MDESVSFGQTVRRRRRSLDLTQEELARHAGYSASAIRKVEADSLRPSREMVERLADALRIPAEQRPWLSRLARGAPAETGSPTSGPALAHHAGSAPPHNLPAIRAGFVGRHRETAEIKALLSEPRLVTITGSGGVGKSSLALRVATDLVDGYSDGVWLVELASLADARLVSSTVARAFGAREMPGQPIQAALLEALRARHCLVILDNCEHLIGECRELADSILRACPRVSLLVTSREPLRIAGETVWRLLPLDVPPADGITEPGEAGHTDEARRLQRYEAAQLLVLRARAMLPDFALTAQNASAVAEICRRLDGIPLALELAASRVTVLSPQQIASRLDDRFRLLTGGIRTSLPRHQTMKAAIDWSYDLLSESEQALFRCLAVFAGGFSIEMAEVVCAGEGIEPPEVLDLLSHLVDKSLVVVEARRAEARYRLLETIRQYALEALLSSGEEAGARARHLDWCLDLARRADPELQSAESIAWLDRLDAEHDNLRAALAWCLEHDVQSGLEMASHLMVFWDSRGHFQEGWSWSSRLLARDSSETIVRVRALRTAGLMVAGFQDWDTCDRLLSESFALARRLGDRREVGWGAFHLARVSALRTGQDDVEFNLFEEALAIGREVGDARLISHGLEGLGVATKARGERRRGHQLLEESLALARQMGASHAVAWRLWLIALAEAEDGDLLGAESKLGEMVALCREEGHAHGVSDGLNKLGYIAVARGDPGRAKDLLRESVATTQRFGITPGIAGACLWLAGLIAVASGDHDRGARIFGALDLGWQRRQAFLISFNQPPFEAAKSAARSALGEEAFARAWTEGQAMTLEEAVDYALQEPA